MCVFLLVPDEEAVDVSYVRDNGIDPGDLHSVWPNLGKAQIGGCWYSY